MAARRGRRKYGRKTVKRRSRKVVSPLAHIARKVQGIDTRVHHLEGELGTLPKRFVRRKHKAKKHRLGTLEAPGTDYWASGE